jgi:hypothetical protein
VTQSVSVPQVVLQAEAEAQVSASGQALLMGPQVWLVPSQTLLVRLAPVHELAPQAVLAGV